MHPVRAISHRTRCPRKNVKISGVWRQSRSAVDTWSVLHDFQYSHSLGIVTPFGFGKTCFARVRVFCMCVCVCVRARARVYVCARTHLRKRERERDRTRASERHTGNEVPLFGKRSPPPPPHPSPLLLPWHLWMKRIERRVCLSIF